MKLVVEEIQPLFSEQKKKKTAVVGVKFSTVLTVEEVNDLLKKLDGWVLQLDVT